MRPWFEPERPGPLVWSHVVRTGHGRCLVDRWPNPRTVLAEVGGNISLRGDPEHLSDPDEPIAGFVDAPESFLASSELAWGAFDEGRLVSVAVPFYLGEQYEDLGVVTEQAFRRRGLSTACAAAVVTDTLARGRRAHWATTPDNHGSLGVAARLGFRLVREDVLYLVRTPVPTS